MPGRRGNTNAVKHGLYSKRRDKSTTPSDPDQVIAHLEAVLSKVIGRLDKAKEDKAFAALANACATCSTAIFTGYRTKAFLTGKIVPVDVALQELEALEFDAD